MVTTASGSSSANTLPKSYSPAVFLALPPLAASIILIPNKPAGVIRFCGRSLLPLYRSPLAKPISTFLSNTGLPSASKIKIRPVGLSTNTMSLSPFLPFIAGIRISYASLAPSDILDATDAGISALTSCVVVTVTGLCKINASGAEILPGLKITPTASTPACTCLMISRMACLTALAPFSANKVTSSCRRFQNSGLLLSTP